MKAHKYEGNMTDNTRIALLEQSIGHINETMIRMEKKFDGIDKRFDELDKKFDGRFDSLNNRLWSLHFWMIGGFSSVLLILAHAVHWI